MYIYFFYYYELLSYGISMFVILYKRMHEFNLCCCLGIELHLCTTNEYVSLLTNIQYSSYGQEHRTLATAKG